MGVSMSNQTAELELESLSSEKPIKPEEKGPSKLPKVAFWLLVVTGLVILLAWVLLPNKPASNWFSKSIIDYQIVPSSGLSEVTPKEVDQILQDYMGNSFWEVPIEVIQGRLNQLDWVVKSEVSRVWPNSLKIHIYEQRPLARWGEAGLINQNGQVFFPYSLKGYEHYMILDGELKESHKVLQRFQMLEPMFKENGFVMIGLAHKAGDIWRVELANQQELIFKETGWQRNLQQFFLAYAKLTDEVRNSAQTFDLRYSNGFVVGKKHHR